MVSWPTAKPKCQMRKGGAGGTGGRHPADGSTRAEASPPPETVHLGGHPVLGQLADPRTHGDITDENIMQQLLSMVTSPWCEGLVTVALKAAGDQRRHFQKSNKNFRLILVLRFNGAGFSSWANPLKGTTLCFNKAEKFDVFLC